jgi:hypothetical protein
MHPLKSTYPVSVVPFVPPEAQFVSRAEQKVLQSAEVTGEENPHPMNRRVTAIKIFILW